MEYDGLLEGTFTDRTITLTVPKRAEWSCEVLPKVVWTPPSNADVPNWFHRLMQRWFFGFKWKYNK